MVKGVRIDRRMKACIYLSLHLFIYSSISSPGPTRGGSGGKGLCRLSEVSCRNALTHENQGQGRGVHVERGGCGGGWLCRHRCRCCFGCCYGGGRWWQGS